MQVFSLRFLQGLNDFQQRAPPWSWLLFVESLLLRGALGVRLSCLSLTFLPLSSTTSEPSRQLPGEYLWCVLPRRFQPPLGNEQGVL